MEEIKELHERLENATSTEESRDICQQIVELGEREGKCIIKTAQNVVTYSVLED